MTVLNFQENPRVQRQLRAMQDGVSVITVGRGQSRWHYPHIDLEVRWKIMIRRVNLLALPRAGVLALLMLLRLHALAEPLLSMSWTSLPNWRVLRRLQNLDVDFILAHDVQTVWLASRLAPPTRVAIDLPEISASQNESSLVWRLTWGRQFTFQTHQARSCARRFSTVSRGLQKLFSERFKISTDFLPNMPGMSVDFRFSLSEKGPIRLVHTGAAIPSRGLETMIDAVSQVAEVFSLDLYLTFNSSRYQKTLTEYASLLPNIRICEPVRQSDLLTLINAYDAMLIFVAPTNSNQRYCLPNKFFDAIQARVPIISGPTPDIVQIVENEKLGWITNGFDTNSLRSTLNCLSRKDLKDISLNLERAALKYVADDASYLRAILGLDVDEPLQSQA